MNSNLLTTSPVWTAAGWTMLHLVWVGAAIGLMAALVRRLLKSARPETRYGVALVFLLALAVSPVVIFVRIFEPDSVPHGHDDTFRPPTRRRAWHRSQARNARRQPVRPLATWHLIGPSVARRDRGSIPW